MVPHLVAKPPDRRMKEEKSFDGGLGQVPHIIRTAYVRQFVSEHCLQLLRAQRHQCRRGHQDHCSDNPHSQRPLNVFGNQKIYPALNPKPMAQPRKVHANSLGSFHRGLLTQPLKGSPPGDGSG